MSEGELECWIVVMDWMGWNNFLTCIHLFLMKVWMRKKISKNQGCDWHFFSLSISLLISFSWLIMIARMSENRGRHQIVCFVVVFSAQVKILKGLFTCTDKMNTIMLLLRPLPILEMGMIVLGFVLLLLLLTVQNKTKVDPLFYGTTRQTLL